MAQIPILDNWKINFRGGVTGVVSNHPDPDFLDGEILTTSKVTNDKSSLVEGEIVVTQSGSKYKLGLKKGARVPVAKEKETKKPAPTPAVAAAKKDSKKVASADTSATSSSGGGGGFFNLFGNINDNVKEEEPPITNGATPNIKSKPKPKQPSPSSQPTAEERRQMSVAEEAERIAYLRELKIQYGLTGKVVGNDGKYLLCGTPQRSTSGKSQIWAGYKAGSDGLPTGDALTIKISNNYDSMERENQNYNKVCSGIFPGQFVVKSDFIEEAGKDFKNQCALVMEMGRKDLKAILAERLGRRLEGRALRDAAASAAQCIQAMHSSGIVWTDLKSENFVVCGDEIGDGGGLPGVKGIDLESAMPYKSNPVDFSPEACPPEFAQAFIAGEGLEFTLDYSYDMWSYGMMLYELSTGKPYFDGKTPAQITKVLRLGIDFSVDTSEIADSKLRDLVNQLLNTDPSKRPSITQVLLHPFFITTGIGAFGF